MVHVSWEITNILYLLAGTGCLAGEPRKGLERVTKTERDQSTAFLPTLPDLPAPVSFICREKEREREEEEEGATPHARKRYNILLKQAIFRDIRYLQFSDKRRLAI